MNKKHELIDEMSAALQDLAVYQGIKDFKVDLTKLETANGRDYLVEMTERLGVEHLDLVQKLADIESDVILQRMLLRKTKKLVRIYMVSAFDLASRDLGSESDPYLRLTIGDYEINERENYQLDEPNP